MQSRAIYSYHDIYTAAKNQDEETLLKALESGTCVNITKIIRNIPYVPVSQLAAEGDFRAVRLLRELYEDIDTNDIIYGYAMGGHTDQVQELLNNGTGINQAIHGSAVGGYTDQVNRLRDANNATHTNLALHGYAIGGHIAQMNKLLVEDANIDQAAYGSAIRGSTDEVNALINKGASINSIVYAYAMGGHTVQVDQLLHRGADMSMALQGYAMSGNITAVNELLKKGADRDQAIYTYASGGHSAEVNDLLRLGNVNIHQAIYGYIMNGHVSQANILILLNTEIINKDDIVYVYALKGYCREVNKLLKIGADRQSAIDGYNIGGYSDHRTELLNIYSLETTLFKEMYNQLTKMREERTPGGGSHRSYLAICEAAKNNDRPSLHKILQSGTSIHLQLKTEEFPHRPVTYFAFKNDHKAVQLLLNLGAHKTDAIVGFALGGHIDQVNRLMERENQPTIAATAYSYAIMGQIEKANGFLEKNQHRYKDDATYNTAYKLAIKGRKDKANSVLEKASCQTANSQVEITCQSNGKKMPPFTLFSNPIFTTLHQKESTTLPSEDDPMKKKIKSLP